MKFILRRVDTSDKLIAEAIRLMHIECFGYGWGDVSENASGSIYWVAYCGREAAGFAVLSPSARWDKTGYLSRAGVLPKFRGRGLQKKLVRVRLRATKWLGWGWVVTDTLSDNPHSMKNLIDCGFRPYEPVIVWGHSSSVYWRRRV